jgi:ATP-binding cassette subfamily C protein CydCD
MIMLLDTPPTVQEPLAPVPMPHRADVMFDAVTFAYPQSETPALISASFRIRERQLVALVGPSGAGKSTILALLLRWFDPQAGAIRIGGVDIKDLSLDGLRSMISVVSQDTYLFHGSIEDNIRIVKPAATLEEIRAAARVAHVDDFIASLPRGYATEVGERGSQLSGGQRQRLAIARAVLKDAPILLLDEATSNTDPATDLAIQSALDTFAGQRTSIVIAHRLSTIRRSDQILVLEQGRLIEQGRHRELLAQGGAYARFLGTP